MLRVRLQLTIMTIIQATFASGLFVSALMCVAQHSHVFQATTPEYMFLQQAAASGANRYNTWCDFEAKVASSGGEIVWTITIDNPQVLNVWRTWMAETSAEVINAIDFDSLSEDGVEVLRIIQSLNRKLAIAQANPVYPLTILTGHLSPDSGAVADIEPLWPLNATTNTGSSLNGAIAPRALHAVKLELDDWHDHAAAWTIDIVGPGLDGITLKELAGRPVLVHGYIKQPGTIEATKILELKPNTVEIVTMSQCPFGNGAVQGMMELLYHISGTLPRRAERTRLQIRYMFYKRSPSELADASAAGPTHPQSPWWCMHGEGELRENLVQMCIRDHLSEFFHRYLRARLASSQDDWKTIAQSVGISEDHQAFIATVIDTQRDEMIEAEYAYVAGLHGITDGTPTWIWESRIIPDIRRIKQFKDINLAGGSCSGKH